MVLSGRHWDNPYVPLCVLPLNFTGFYSFEYHSKHTNSSKFHTHNTLVAMNNFPQLTLKVYLRKELNLGLFSCRQRLITLEMNTTSCIGKSKKKKKSIHSICFFYELLNLLIIASELFNSQFLILAEITFCLCVKSLK